jgi:hypothetical protein
MTTVPVASPRDSHPAAPRDRSAGVRRGLLLLAIVLTVLAGPLGRATDGQVTSDENVRPVTVTSSEAAAPR